jgi:thiol:disulfide interchange protein DsbD
LTDGDAAARRSLGGKFALVALGLVILALAVFALLNVDLLDQWGASLATRFRGGLPLPVALLVVFVAGILTSLTPCVYPVVPLAITYLGARTATSRLRAFSLAGAYVIGMVACYTLLGAVAGLTGTTFGAATQRWWVYALVATVVVVFGLSMLGVFTIALPSSLQGLIGRGKGPGYRGALFMGATSGLVTAPCTAPVLGTLILR